MIHDVRIHSASVSSCHRCQTLSFNTFSSNFRATYILCNHSGDIKERKVFIIVAANLQCATL
jgi:hypothetical protein